MKITLLLVNKTDPGPVSDLFGLYCSRIRNYCTFQVMEIVSKNKGSGDARKVNEGELVLKKFLRETW